MLDIADFVNVGPTLRGEPIPARLLPAVDALLDLGYSGHQIKLAIIAGEQVVRPRRELSPEALQRQVKLRGKQVRNDA